MKAKTLKALKGSIKKWEKIVAGTGSDLGPKNCPLCSLFWKADPDLGLQPDSCIGCPVHAATGETGCRSTPYDDYEFERTTENAEAELEFLRSLLPAETSLKTAD